MSAPRFQCHPLLFFEVVASINLRDARATIGLVEDVANRYLRLACARGPVGFFCCPCFFDCFCLLLLSLSFLPPLSPMVSPFGHYGLSPTTGLGAV